MSTTQDERGHGDQQRRIQRNARQIGTYLEMHAALSIQGAIPETPQGRKEKGKSRTPASEALEKFVFANRLASRYIDWRIAHLRRSGNAYGGVRFAAVIERLYRDPGCVSQWENGDTDEDRAGHKAWRKMCYLVAQNIMAEHPDLDIHVVVNPEPLSGLDEEEDATPLKKPGADHHRSRRYTAEHTYRKRYERVQEIRRVEGCTKTAAVERMADEYEIGLSTAWESVKACEEDCA